MFIRLCTCSYIWDRFYYWWTQLPVNQGPEKCCKSRIMLAQLLSWQLLIHYLSTCHQFTFWALKYQESMQRKTSAVHTREFSLALEKIKLKRFKTSLATWFSQIVCLFSTPVFCVMNSDALYLMNFLKFEYKHCTQINRWLLQNKTVSPPLVLIH